MTAKTMKVRILVRVGRERHEDRGRAAFCDGGATRLKFASERLRAALGISPAEYEEMEAEQ